MPDRGSLTLRQVADRLNVGLTTARGLLSGPDPVPHLRLGRGPKAGVRVPVADFEAWLQRRVEEDTARDSGEVRARARSVIDLDALARRDGVRRRVAR